MVDEELGVLIDVAVLDRELDQLIGKLLTLEAVMSRVDDQTIHVDVDRDGQLTRLLDALDGDTLQGLGMVGGSGMEGMNFRNAMRKLANSSDEASDGLLNMDLRMTDLHNALAKLVPIILVMIGALPALVTALVGLAGAAIAAAAGLAAIAGLGLLGAAMARGGGVEGIGQGFEEIMREVRDDFLDAFAPIAEQLAPLFERGLDALDKVFQRIANQRGAFEDFAEVAGEVGAALTEMLPGAFAQIAGFANAMMPVFGALGEALQGGDFLPFLAAFFEQALPSLIRFIDALKRFLPLLIEMSVGFLRVTSHIIELASLMMWVITGFGLFGEQAGFVIGVLLTMATVIMLLNGSLLPSLGSALVSLGQTLIAAATTTGTFSGALSALRGSIMATLPTLAALKAAIVGLMAATGVGLLITVVGTIAGKFLTTSSSIDEATKSLKRFQQQSNRMSGNNPYGIADPNVSSGSVGGGGGGTVNVTVEGNADAEVVRNQAKNALYRLNKGGQP